jgi:hypothetical protein
MDGGAEDRDCDRSAELTRRDGRKGQRAVGPTEYNGGIPGFSSSAMYPPTDGATIVLLVNKPTLEGGPADFLFYDIAGLLFPEQL